MLGSVGNLFLILFGLRTRFHAKVLQLCLSYMKTTEPKWCSLALRELILVLTSSKQPTKTELMKLILPSWWSDHQVHLKVLSRLKISSVTGALSSTDCLKMMVAHQSLTTQLRKWTWKMDNGFLVANLQTCNAQ